MPSYLKAFGRRATIFRSLKVSAVIGSILILINHWDTVTALAAPPLWQVLLTYAVPFLVSAHAEASALSSADGKGGDTGEGAT